MSRTLIIIGLLIVAAGLAWPLIARSGLGRLPGDIFIQRDGFRLYIPIASSLLVSIVISLVLWFFNR